MDRTVIAPYKAEEKDLSEKLYRKLQGLTLVYPPTDEFRKCLTSDMFIKANQVAFFQVMHFLFRLHDPVEFKKRFYWPISDKRSEASFRSSTVEYLKFLSDKHQLNWNIKSYLVVMPGGMKFITFMLDLVGFVLQEQVRLREKELGVKVSPDDITETNLSRMQKQNEFFKEYASQYIVEIDEYTATLREKTEMLKKRIHNFESNFPNCIINKEFLNAFDAENEKLFEKKYVEHAQHIESLGEPLNILKSKIEKFQNKATDIRRDKGNLKEALHKIFSTEDSPELEENLGARLNSPDSPSMNSMAKAFAVIAPTMENWLSNVIGNSCTDNHNVTSKLNDLKIEFQQVEKQVVDFQKKYNPSKIKQKEADLSSIGTNSTFNSKYIHTPPIKLNVAENISARLPLQEGTNFLDRCGNYQTLMNRTIQNPHRGSMRDESFELNSTLNRSRIDPAQLLRTIYKNSHEKSNQTKQQRTKQRQNLSIGLGLKWKERQKMFESETPLAIGKSSEPIKLIDTIDAHKQHSSALQIQPSPKTPFNTTNCDITRINMLCVPYEKSPPSAILLKKSSMVKKVQDASLNIKNLSTSPSGRLEALMPVESLALEEYEQLIIEKPHAFDNNDDISILNTPRRHAFDLSDLNDDSIFNTSSTILNDIE